MLNKAKSLLSSFPQRNWDTFLDNAVLIRKNQKEIKHNTLDTKHTDFYLGSWDIEENDSIYSKTYTQWLLAYGLKNLPKDQNMRVVIVGKLREILNQDLNENIQTETQVQQLNSTIQRDFPDQQARINIEYIQDKHPELFELLEKQWIQWLRERTLPDLDKNNFSSMDIATYLVHAVQKDTKLFKKFYRTMPKPRRQDNQMQWNKDHEYYAIIEIAIRITDYLGGTTHQVWPKRQIMFDERLHLVIKESSKNNIIQQLQKFIHSIQKEDIYTGIYIDPKKIQENKKEKKNATIKALRNTLIGVMTGSVLVGGFWYNDVIEKKEQEELKVELQEKIKHLKISTGLTLDNIGTNPISDLHYVESFVMQYHKSLVDLIKNRYNNGSHIDEMTEIRLLEYISQQSFWDERNRDITQQTNEKVNFIDHVFIPENRLFLKKTWISTTPYPELQKHKDIIENMQSYNGKKIVFTSIYDPKIALQVWWKMYQDAEIKTMQEFAAEWPGMNRQPMFFREIGTYITQEDKQYRIALRAPKGRAKRSVLIAYPEDEYDGNIWFIYTSDAGKIVAKDYIDILQKLDIKP